MKGESANQPPSLRSGGFATHIRALSSHRKHTFITVDYTTPPPELSLKRDRSLTKAYSKSPLSLSPCNSCGITASCQRDFGDFCRARQKLLAKRACEASRAK